MYFFNDLVRTLSINNLCRSEIENLQLKKLRNLLRYVYKNSYYYKSIFDSLGIGEREFDNFKIEDLHKIPIIDKNIYVDNFDDIVCDKNLNLADIKKFDEENEFEFDKLYKNVYHIVHTSGTETMPFYVAYDRDAWNEMKLGITRIALFSLSLDQIRQMMNNKIKVAIVMSFDGRYAGCSSINDSLKDLGIEYKNIDVSETLNYMLDELNSFSPNFIIGYTSIVMIIAKMKMENELDIYIDRVITCGEPLMPEERTYIENAFNTKVINCYGTSESIALGVEESINGGINIFDDMNIIEEGENAIYLTNLYNFKQPFIRYKINDVVEFDNNMSKNIYPYRRIKNIKGRYSDVLWLNKSDFIHPLMIEGFKSKGVLDFQIVKLDDSSFDINLLMDNSSECVKNNSDDFILASEKIRSMINNILNKKNIRNVNYEINNVRGLIIDPITKKKKIVIN